MLYPGEDNFPCSQHSLVATVLCVGLRPCELPPSSLLCLWRCPYSAHVQATMLVSSHGVMGEEDCKQESLLQAFSSSRCSLSDISKKPSLTANFLFLCLLQPYHPLFRNDPSILGAGVGTEIYNCILRAVTSSKVFICWKKEFPQWEMSCWLLIPNITYDGA